MPFFFFFFFFKQKTAYEMRISDWSSDVCSSDLFCVEVVDCTMMNLSWAAAGAVAPAKASPAVVAAASARKERLSMAISLFGDGSQQQPAFQVGLGRG